MFFIRLKESQAACQWLSWFVCAVLVLLLGSCETIRAANLTNAGSVKLAWDRSATDTLTNGVTYFLSASNQSTLTATNVLTGTNTTITLTNMDAGRWVFAAYAQQGGLISTNSNLLFYDVPAVPPFAPGQLRTIFLDYTIDLSTFTPFAGFRARIQ